MWAQTVEIVMGAYQKFGKQLELTVLDMPGKVPLTPNGEPLPHVIVSDEGVSIKNTYKCPYSTNHLWYD